MHAMLTRIYSQTKTGKTILYMLSDLVLSLQCYKLNIGHNVAQASMEKNYHDVHTLMSGEIKE